MRRIVLNSKDLKKGDIFIPYGGVSDRTKYIEDALKKKCSLVITDSDYQHKKVCQVKNLDTEIINIFNEYYNYPLQDIKLIGITGTDGKTTIASILSDLLKGASIGTNGFQLLNKNYKLENTTPSLDVLYDCFQKTALKKVKTITMEVSSEAYLTKRIANLPFDIGILSNITLDHLDKHKTKENYISCKEELFKNSKIAILNHDSKYYKRFKNLSQKTYSYGFNPKATLRILSYKLFFDKSIIRFSYLQKKYELTYPLLGKFNVYNVAASLLTMLVLGYDIQDIMERFKNVNQVLGRMEVISFPSIKVVLDYAHTTNATYNVLKFFHKFNKNLIVVVGCAGGRYQEKRKEIGALVLKYAKLAIFTSDDSRYENPNEIINDMLKKTKKTNYLKIIDRKEAIKYAIKRAKSDDLVLILGKGRDDYIFLKDKKIPYSDYQEIYKNCKKK